MPAPSVDSSNLQANPDLTTSASLAAYMFGYHLYALLYLNPSNDSIGSTYDVYDTGLGRIFGSFGTGSVGLTLGRFSYPYEPETPIE